MRGAILFVLCSLATPQADAQVSKWIEMPHPDYDGRVFSYDANTVTRSGDVVTYWEKEEYVTPAPDDHAIRRISFMRTNCATRSYAMLQQSGYDQTGHEIGTWVAKTPEVKRYVPDSVGEMVMLSVCKRRR